MFAPDTPDLLPALHMLRAPVVARAKELARIKELAMPALHAEERSTTQVIFSG